MKTMLKRFVAGATMTVLASAFSGCSPVLVAPSRPRPVVYNAPVYASPPVQAVQVTPVVPVWAPPYTYVTEVHYYYFPDYMVYYDVFDQHYCYNDGFNWVHVAVLPSMPLFYGFNPSMAYIIVLNHNTYQPWIQHDFYAQEYPAGYYKTMYSPRTSLGTNTVLRAYDENQNKPVFVDRRSNKEVAVKYDVRSSRKPAGTNSPANAPVLSPAGRTPASDRHGELNPVSDRPKNNSSSPGNDRSIQHSELNIRPVETSGNHDSKEASMSTIRGNHNNDSRGLIKNNQPAIHSTDSGFDRKNPRQSMNSGRIKEDRKINQDSWNQNREQQKNSQSK